MANNMQVLPAKTWAWTRCFSSHKPRKSIVSGNRVPEHVAGSRRLPSLASSTWQQQSWLLAVFLSLPLVLCSPVLANTNNYTINVKEEEEEQYFITVPQDLSSTDDDKDRGPRLGSLIEGPNGKAVQSCARKCVPTCIRGGQGAPGLGPMTVRKEVVVFKEGFRSRKYCLRECTQVCALEVNSKAESKR